LFRSAFKWGAVFAAAVSLSACATGGGSFITGHDGGGGAEATADQSGGFDQAAPNLVAASGTALLPGGRSPAADALLGQASPGAVASSVAAGSPLATGLVSTSALSGPLLAVNGQRSALLGLSANSAVLGAPAAASVSLNVGGGSSIQTATTQLIVSANAAVSVLKPIVTPTPVVGGGTVVTTPPLTSPPLTTPPLTAPVLHITNAVPGTVPLPMIIQQLKAGLLGH
jgi:hypothetical protein